MMKFANFRYVAGISYGEDGGRINIGDYIQLFAVENMYRRMGIRKEDIYYLNIDEIRDYVGEYLILPINFIMMDADFCVDGEIAISRYIIPVFIGVSFHKGSIALNDKNLRFLQKYSPIGCRDFRTYQLLKEKDIPAYLFGCLSLTLPYRKKSEGSRKKVFLVDVPEFLRETIPEEYKENAEIIHHEQDMGKAEFESCTFSWEMAEKIFNRYREEAALVVTSRLHCASPCIGMGIPTIIVREYAGYTFGWIDEFADIFLEKDIDRIDWHPKLPEINDMKEKMLTSAIIRMQEAKKQFRYLDMNEMYETYRNRIGYNDSQSVDQSRLIEKIHIRWQDRQEAFSYVIWGLNADAEQIYKCITEEYKNARLAGVIDDFREVEFHGMKSCRSSMLKERDDFVTIVTSVNAVNAAKKYFRKIGKTQKEYLLMANTFMDSLAE